MPHITTFLTYDHEAEDAAKHYVSVLGDGKIVDVMRGGSDNPTAPGRVFAVTFELFGQTYQALNGGPGFGFAPGISLFVHCDTQEEIDKYWAGLTEGGKEVRCGWLVDRFGVSWQIVPKILSSLIGDPDPVKAGRAMQAMMTMQKLDIAALKKAHAG